MITIGGTTRIGGGNGIQTTGSVEINGIRIDFRDPIGTCKRILAKVSDEDKLEFAISIIDEINANGGPKKSESCKAKEVRCEGKQFSSIENSSYCMVYLKQSNDNCSVTVEGKKSDIEKIRTSVSGGILRIEADENTYFGIAPVINVECPSIISIATEESSQVEVTTPIVSEYDDLNINVMGSGNVNCPDVQVPGVDINITASGDVTIDKLKTRSVMASVTGSGDITLKDSVVVSSAKLAVQGSGDVRFYGSAKTINASVTGSGDIRGRVSCDMMNARVTGSGGINFTGNIKSKTQRVMGTGDIHIN